MPLVGQNDVANSGTRPGYPVRFAGMTISALPTGPLARKEDAGVPSAISASGLNVRYGTRFDDPTYYTA
jgi:hypothetical protein